MKAENWQNIKEVLMTALALDVSERREFLDNADITSENRAEVESLLAFEVASEDLMDLSAVEFSKDFFDEDEANVLVGQTVGVYKVVRELGQGGMGAVYLATRNDGKFNQKVALKLLKREMNTSTLRRHFQQEQSILASLEHPHIARLLDAGTTADKAPFLAMEYVEGLPVDEYCNLNGLDLNQRLDLFRKVCSTVNFAHRNLIVHRDLKPSNILVNDEGVPKLLDFGISKILSAEFEQINAATVTKLGAMTPSYASPEQLQGKSVTTATDIYSLGVILYELLSGHRPFETKEDDLKEIYKAVLDNEPLPPSRIQDSEFKIQSSGFKIQDSGLEINDLSDKTEIIFNQTKDQNQQTNSKSRILNPKSLTGDLDNIVLKALRKEPERRYTSAENFAEDIHRHQRGLPVTARPNTFSYRAEKFFKRNKAGAIAGMLVLLAIIVGIATTLWQAKVAKVERTKAEKRFGDVRKLANSYLFDIFPEIENLEGSLKAREKILKTALEYLDSLSREAEGDTELQLELATAYEKIGEVQGAVNIANLGDIKAGLESYRKAQSLRESAFNSNQQDLKNKEALSKNYQVTAQTLMWNIDTAKASQFYEKAIKIRRELVKEKPESPDFQNRLAVLLTDYANIATINVENDKAAKLLDEALIILKETLKNNPDHFPTRKAYPRALRAYATLKSNTGDYDGAIRNIDESVVLTNELIKLKPDDYTLRRTAFVNDNSYCEIYVARRDGQKIVEACLKTVDFNVKTLQKEPDESFAQYDLAISYYNIAQGYRLSNHPHRSIEYARKSLESLSKLNKTSPDINDYQRGVAVVENEIGDSLLLIGETADALTHLQNAQNSLEKVVITDPTVTSYQRELANIYRSEAKGLYKINQASKSVKLIGKAIEIVRRHKESNALRDADKNLLVELETEKAVYSK